MVSTNKEFKGYAFFYYHFSSFDLKYPGDKQQRSKNVTTKRLSKKNNRNQVKIELQTTTVTVNEKLLPGDASISLFEPSSMLHTK